MIYIILYKTLIGPKPLRIRFNKIDGRISIYCTTRYLVLLGPEKYAIYNRIRIKYLIGLEVFYHYFVKIKIGSCDYLPIVKRIDFT